MNYYTTQIKILNIYGLDTDSQFIEFKDFSDDKIKILKRENFLKRYNIQIKNKRK